MFDWNEEDGVADAIWGDFKDREDHIVPYPEDREDDTLFKMGDYCSKQKGEQKSTDLKFTEQNTSGSKNVFPDCNLDSGSCFHSEEEFSGSRNHMDPWPNFPSVNSTLGKGGCDGNDQGSTSSGMVNDLTDAPNFDHGRDCMFTEFCPSGDSLDDNDPSSLKEASGFSFDGGMELDSKPGIFSRDHGPKEVDSFLDCDWGSITDFDDLDGIFRSSESIFGHEMISNADELLSPTDSINTTPPFPMPNISRDMDIPVDKRSSSTQVDEYSQGKRKVIDDHKIADHTFVSEQTGGLSQSLDGNYCNFDPNKVNVQKRLPKSRRKMDEKRVPKSQNLTGLWPHSGNQYQQSGKYAPVSPGLQSFPSAALSQQRQLGGHEFVNYFPPSQQALTGYGYPAFAVPSTPVLPPVPAVRKQHQPGSDSYNVHPYGKHSCSLQRPPEVSSKTLTMTPQEKIEKLRRRQQMQAMLAIKQQEKHLGQKLINTEVPLSQNPLQINQSQGFGMSTIGTEESAKRTASDFNMPAEQDGLHNISAMSDDYSLQETIYYELQEAIMKLDNNLRLCMRDSLFRLAKSAMERRNTSDRSSNNIGGKKEDEVLADEPTSILDRSSRIQDAETDTNPLDRIVAHLLFHRPQDSSGRLVEEEMSAPPISGNVESRQTSIWESKSADKSDDAKVMDGNVTLKVSLLDLVAENGCSSK